MIVKNSDENSQALELNEKVGENYSLASSLTDELNKRIKSVNVIQNKWKSPFSQIYVKIE